MVVVKLLNMAIQDKDKIYAVIRRKKLNDGGIASTLTGDASPSKESQTLHLKSVHETLNVHQQPYIEAEGNCTEKGYAGVAIIHFDIMGKSRGKERPTLTIDSLESYFRHLKDAPRAAKVIMAGLLLQKKQIPQSERLSIGYKSIQWDECKLVALTKLMEWTKGFKHFVDSSSFGFGGSSADLFLEAAPTVKGSSYSANKCFPMLWLLSANAKNTLEERVSDWLLFLQDCLDHNFRNILHTAAVRLMYHNYRLAFPCESLKQSLDILTNWQKFPERVKDTVVGGYTQAMPAQQDQSWCSCSQEVALSGGVWGDI